MRTVKGFSMFLLVAMLLAAAPQVSFAGANKTGGNYTVLMDSVNARGGQSTGGNYTAFSSIGQRVPGAVTTGGSYTAVGGVLGAVDTTPPEIAISGPVADTAASGTISLTGTAFDRNGITWTLYVGGGDSPSSWTQVKTGSGNQAANYTFGSWDSTYYSGVYTFRLAAVDGHGNSFERTVPVSVEYVYTITGTYPEDEWVFSGVPVDASSADPLEIFGTEAQYKIYRWDPVAEDDEFMERYTYPETLAAGSGFWIKAFYDDIAYSYTGSPVVTNQQYATPLHPGWNQICAPYNNAFQWDYIQVESGGRTYGLAEAAQAGLIDPVLYAYDPDSESWVQRAGGNTMQPREGFFVWAYQEVELLFDPEYRVLAKIVRRATDYRVNISAAASRTADRENYFGSEALAERGPDPYDSFEPPRAMPGIEGDYTTLYFTGSGAGRNAGRVANDMRPLAARIGDTESWPLTVETSEVGETVTLEWDNASLPLDRFSFTLADLAAGETVDMGKQGSYSYTAEGGGVSAARFRIDVKKTAEKDVSASYAIGPGWNLVSIPLEMFDTEAESQLGETLNKLEVAQFYDGRFYFPESEGGVDFQAGIGYWMYSTEDIELKFTGQPVDGAAEIEVPLKKGYNMIGSPFASGLTFGDNLSVKTEEKTYPLDEAVKAGLVDGSIYFYDTASGEYVASGTGGVMEAWKGYVVIVRQECTLLLRK